MMLPEVNMLDTGVSALVSIRDWGQSLELEKILKYNSSVVSVFHMMGGSSYIIDTAFESKKQLEEWIRHMKAVKLAGGVPAILNMQTQKVIEADKQKQQYSLSDYLSNQERLHFFMFVDTFGDSNDFLEYTENASAVQSVVHIQGEHSYVIEIISDNYDDYKVLLHNIKNLKSVNRVVTQEVISVLKYRGEISDEAGQLLFPEEDTREIFSL